MVNDNGGEYLSTEFNAFIKEHGIRMLLTAPYSPQQNPIAEIGNRTTTEKARALLKNAGMPMVFWGEAVSTAVYLENRTPVASRGFKTPYELWHGVPPSCDHLRVFGCLAYVHIGRERRSGKFSDTAKRGVFVGYQEGHHNYRVWLPNEKHVVYSHDVLFNETCFPLNGSHSLFTESAKTDSLTDLSSFSFESDHIQINDQHLHSSNLSDEESVIPSSATPDTLVSTRIVEGGPFTQTTHPDAVSSDKSNSTGPEVTHATDTERVLPLSATTDSSPSQNLTPARPLAVRDINSNINPSNILPTRTRRSGLSAIALLSSSSTSSDPTTYAQASTRADSACWIAAMDRELKALESMNGWTEVDLPAGEHALGTTWVYKKKTGPTGELVKHKARLCAQGFSQIEGIDFTETFAPTGRLATLRTALGISAYEEYDIVQMDAVGAFLNGIPDETLYIKPPKGYICKNKGKNVVLRLNKSLYGLKQSPRCWYRQLRDFFESINFQPSKADPCFFISSDPLWKCGVFIHVDDLCIMGQNTQRFKDLINTP